MACEPGSKYDGGKARWDLLPWAQLADVVSVLTFGAEKYDDNNWQHVPDGEARYFAAAMRHMVAWRTGERCDRESGLPHLAHAVTCLLFAMWFDHE